MIGGLVLVAVLVRNLVRADNAVGQCVDHFQLQVLAYADRMKVWLNNWEWQCCGDYFEVGSEVEWDLMPFGQKRWEWLDDLGEELLDTITYYAAPDDHIEDEERLQAVRTPGRVESVTSVHHRTLRWDNWWKRDLPAAVFEARAGLDFARSSNRHFVGPEGFIVELSPGD